MKAWSIRRVVIIGMVAAVYTVLTAGFGIVSYGPMQIRLAEMLSLLAFFNPVFIAALTLGTFLANMFSPYGVLDMIFGTLATFIAISLVWATGRLGRPLFVAALWPVVVNAAIIPFLIIFVTDMPLSLLSYVSIAGSIAAGQFIVMFIFAYPLFRLLLHRYPSIIGFFVRT